MEDHALAAVAAGAGAAVGAPAAVAAIPVVVAEDLPATHPVTAALAPVPKLFCRRCFAPFDVYPPVFTSYEFLQMSAIDFNFSTPPLLFLVLVSLWMILVCSCTTPTRASTLPLCLLQLCPFFSLPSLPLPSLSPPLAPFFLS